MLLQLLGAREEVAWGERQVSLSSLEASELYLGGAQEKHEMSPEERA